MRFRQDRESGTPRRHTQQSARQIMTGTLLKTVDGTPVSSEAIEEFSSGLAGKAIGPDHRRYDRARKIWNASIDKHPGLIVRCAGVADVVSAVNFARTNNIRVAIRGGGHNVAGRALVDDGLVIDLSRMRAVFVDKIGHTARVQGGATLGDIDRETHIHGLAVPTGVVSETGIGGLALGGGVGWLVRRYGDDLRQCPGIRGRHSRWRGADGKCRRKFRPFLGPARRRWQFWRRHVVPVQGA